MESITNFKPQHINGQYNIDVICQCDDWMAELVSICQIIQNVANHALNIAVPMSSHNIQPNQSIDACIVLTNDKVIKDLNKNFRGKNKPTNVLSFANLEGDMISADTDMPIGLGDVILAFETVKAEAIDQDKTFANHVSHLVIHGVLHLLGFDHEDDNQASQMESIEIELLDTLNIPNPYEL